MRVCWFGFYDRAYARNSILIAGLEMHGVRVVPCTTTQTGIKKYVTLIRQLRSLRDQYDMVYCAFPALYNVMLAWLFQKKPVVMDAFFPMHEAMVEDRKTFSRFHPKACLWYVTDIISVWLADLIICDTSAHVEFWRRLSGRKYGYHVIPVGAHSKEFFLTTSSYPSVTVTFHGSYIPLQGVEVIVDAVAILREHHHITWRFIGRGQTYDAIVKKINDLDLQTHIELVPWVSITDLNLYLNSSTIILGIFGTTNKADRVIPNKLFHGLALGKTVITKDTPVARHLLGSSVYYASSEQTASSLAEIIKYVVSTQDYTVAEKGKLLYEQEFSEMILGKRLKEQLQSLL